MPLACSRRHLGGSEPMYRARQFSQLFLGCIFKKRPAQMDMEKPPARFHWSFLFLVNLAALWFVAICRYFALKQCGTVAISKTCLLSPEVFRKRFWCNVILVLMALGIDGFCCRQRAVGSLAENSWLFRDHFLQDCQRDSFIIAFAAWAFVESVGRFVVRTSSVLFMNFLSSRKTGSRLMFSWHHAFFLGQLRMLRLPNWSLLSFPVLLGLRFCGLCPVEDVDIPLAAW